MIYTNDYDSSLGKILLAGDNTGLTGLWFYGQKNFAGNITSKHKQQSTKILDIAKSWLDKYFAGTKPDYLPPLHIVCSPFQYRVFDYLMKKIKYGNFTTYGEIAAKINNSPRTVGRAMAQNNILIIIPCHRVLGSNFSLTGYAAGIERKKKLLELERSK